MNPETNCSPLRGPVPPRSAARSFSRGLLIWAIALGFVASLGTASAGTSALPLTATIVTRTPDAGGALLHLQTAAPATPGGVYLLQTVDRLDPAASWVTREPVVPDAAGLSYDWPLQGESTLFFRLQPPEPAILRIEPGVVSSEGGQIYVIGQSLSTNGALRVASLVGGSLPGGAVLSAYLCTVPPLPPGVYDVEWVEDGKVVARAERLLTSVAGVKPGDAPQRVDGPPEEPPASPLLTRSPGELVDGTLGWSQAGREEGRKGLNAVNVKQAFSDVEEDLDPEEAQPMPARGLRITKPGMDRWQPQRYSGEVIVSAEDLWIAGQGLDFRWVRTYRSRGGRTTPMGVNWDHSYNLFIEQEAGGGIAVNDGAGRRDVYFPDADGVYGRDEFFNTGVLANDGFTLTFPDTGRWVFLPFDGSPRAGRIARIEDRNGNALRFEYDDAGRLVRVIDTLGRPITVAYAGGFVASVTDFTGRVVKYQYHSPKSLSGGAGDLATATGPAVTGTPNGNDFPNGKTTAYTYSVGFSDPRENHLLLAVTDPRGQVPCRYVYQHNQTDLEFLRCVRMTLGDDTNIVTFRYVAQSPSPSNRYAAIKCIVNDAVGNVSECFFDSLNRCVRHLAYTGRAKVGVTTTETDNRPAGKLRKGDPDRFETLYEWNRDSLCTRIVYPRGNSVAMIYERAFHPGSASGNAARRHAGDLRVLREGACCGGVDLDGDGVADVVERAWRFEGDPRFGSAVRVKVKFPWLRGGDDLARGAASLPGWGFARGPRQTTSLDGTYGLRKRSGWIFQDKPDPDLCGRFATSVTDPSGSTVTARYDDRGNLIHAEVTERRSGQLVSADYRYDVAGRITGVTLPADGLGCRRSDTFAYQTDPAAPGFGYLLRVFRDDAGAAPCGPSAPLRLVTSFEVDPLGNVVRIVDPRGNDTIIRYNSLNQRISMNVTVPKQTQGATFGERIATTFTYDANDNLIQVDHEDRDPTGALNPLKPTWTSSAEYDVLNGTRLLAHELAHTVQQGSMATRFVYDGNGNLVLELLPEAVKGSDPNNTLQHQYDERDLPLRITRAPLSRDATSEEFAYDLNGSLAALRNGVATGAGAAAGAATFTFGYDGFGRRVRLGDSMGNVETRLYDLGDNLTLSHVDGEMDDQPGGALNRPLSEVRYAYDSLGRRIRRHVSFFDIFTELSLGDGGSTHLVSYAPNGQVLTDTDDNGNLTRYGYDTAGRLVSITDPRTNVLTMSLDPAGNVVSRTWVERSDLSAAEEQFSITYVYDELNRCLGATDNLGNATRSVYDSRGNCVGGIDERGNEFTRAFDGLGRVTDSLYYDGLKAAGLVVTVSHAEYSAARLVGISDGNGNATRYDYDSLDRPVQVTRADNSRTSLVWSPRSNLISSTDPNGTVVQYSHDLLDRCLRRDITPGPGVAGTTTFEAFAYDGMSRVVRATNDTSSVEFAYDSLGNRVRSIADGLLTTSVFDGEGNRLSITYPGGRVIQSSFAPGNLVSAVGSVPFAGGALSSLASFSYDGPGRLSRVTRANGINTRIVWNGSENPANAKGDFGWRQVSRLNHARAGAPVAVSQYGYVYDPAQNKTERAQLVGYTQGGATTTNYFGYDRMHRLTRGARRSSSGVESSSTYVLDPNGNRQQVERDGNVAVYTMDSTLPDPGDFQMNQYTLTPGGAMSYDRNGNLTTYDTPAGAVLFHYDFADRLVSVEREVGPAVVPVAGYSYDALGRRIAKSTYPSGQGAPVTTRFVHDPGSAGEAILELRRDTKIVGSFCSLPGLDDHVVAAFTGAGAVVYFHTDELGTTLALTSEAGEVIERYDYDDHGAPSFLDPKGAPLLVNGQAATASGIGNPLLFHGMFWDPETALYHDRGLAGENPLYSPREGRYLSRGHRDVGGYRSIAGAGGFTFSGDNPWTVTIGAAGEPGPGRGGDLSSITAQFNPKEYSLRKVIVRGWDPERKEAISRHTPFHNKRTAEVTGEIELESLREVIPGLDVEYRLYGPGQSHWGNARADWGHSHGISIIGNIRAQFTTVSNVLKTRHDTVKNSIGNIR